MQLLTQTDAQPDSSRKRQRLTRRPWFCPIRSLSILQSLISHSPMSQVPARLVAHAFILEENAGKGLANIHPNALGNQDGNRDRRTFCDINCASSLSYLIFIMAASSMSP